MIKNVLIPLYGEVLSPKFEEKFHILQSHNLGEAPSDST